MKKEEKKPVYEPPFARDLSEECATGMDPVGLCALGSHPFNDCQFGSSHQGGCSFGNSPSGCSGGSMPEHPSCRTGSSAMVGCVTGGDA
jgi:hypothetical protein